MAHLEQLTLKGIPAEGKNTCLLYTSKHRPVTKAQTELITQILSDYPDAKDSFEYQDYEKSRTAGAASEFITRAIEERVDLIGKRENYVEYIAKRPCVERQGSHGLFTDGDVYKRQV